MAADVQANCRRFVCELAGFGSDTLTTASRCDRSRFVMQGSPTSAVSKTDD